MTQWEFSSVRVQMTITTRHTFNVVALLLLPLLCFIGLIGNLFVCIAISTDRRLHNVTNYFLFSLAVADLLVCCIVMPISILVEVRHGLWTWNLTWCLVYTYSDVFLCSASIVHMSVISLDRYLGISQPLRTRNKSKTMIFIKIALVWIITLFVSSPIAVLALLDDKNILRGNTCTIFNQQYIIYGSTLTFLVPFCIMAVTYVRTTNLLNKQASILSQRANDKLNGNGLRRTMPHRKLGYMRTNSALTNGFGHKSSTVSVGYKPSVVSYKDSIVEPELSSLVVSNNNIPLSHRSLTKTSSAMNRFKSRTSSYIATIAMRVGRRNSIQAASQELANEHKATRVLAVVFICFFICWTPFFAANFIMGFCGSACALPPWLGSLFLWLGYISSTLNPIIYTVFNKRFRQAFVRILRCQCWHPLRNSQGPYSRNYTTVIPDTYTWSNNERALSMNGREDGNGSLRNDGWRGANGEENGKKTSAQSASPRLAIRDSRATTEENSDEDAMNEKKPLLPSGTVTNLAMRRSLTGLLAPAVCSIPKSTSCIECSQCNLLIDSTDTETTMSSSVNGCPKHVTLFSSAFGTEIRETFL